MVVPFVVVPIVAPILLLDPNANVTAVWLGVMIGVNIQTSFLTPPFGYALFYFKGVAPEGYTMMHIYRGILPFVMIQLFGLGVIAAFPGLATWLPGVLF